MKPSSHETGCSEQFVNLLRIGQSVSAKGYGTENEFGRSVEVTELGAPGQPLTAIYSPINSPATGAPHRLFHGSLETIILRTVG